ncbi:adenosylmethionine--8-amino-7-oxononanoate transaminase [Balneola sp. MJW-20]|uniref:adenosylmethionine--8-amino-7-oxononanoate transaminase n=1 Tax=Gracilimonas aurantiaca TaxID=3234185 RepID=UPI003465270C
MHPNLWHPFTIQKNAPEPVKVKSGKGVWLELEDGRKVIDCISSWWVNVLGHSNQDIADAIYEQSQKLEHVIFAGFTHDPAENLAERLINLLPSNFERVFFSDNGSTAVEVAMKMAYQYWANKGEDRKSYICFEGAYHGDTFGAMSAGERNIFSDVFKDLLFDVEFIPYPQTWDGDEERAQKEDEIIDHLEELLTDNPDHYAGILIEPLVQGAGGMRMCSEEFLQKLHWINRQYDVLLIFDEVMTGFGRTGEMFACKRAQVEPDIICLSKGITGGFMPLSVTVCSAKIYETFLSEDPVKTFWHGHSYTGNPLGCAAAIATLDILSNTQPFKWLEDLHKEEIEKLKGHSDLHRFRIKGTISAMDIKTDGEDGYLNEVAAKIKKNCLDHGVLLRPLGNTLYLMPPYCITEDELRNVYKKIPLLLN